MSASWAEPVVSSPQVLPIADPQVIEAHCIDPLADSRWDGLLRRHPDASVFHSSRWLRALKKTYGYNLRAYTTSVPSEELEDALVFCEVDSWLTGRRLVSLPFSDHCAPLMKSPSRTQALLDAVGEEMGRTPWRYFELRPLRKLDAATAFRRTTIDYAFHTLDLTPSLDGLFSNLHKNSTQRKIRRAEHERLAYREGREAEYLDHFYRLFTATRKRHCIPPPPKRWFANLVESFGKDLKIRLAFYRAQPIAAMITLAYKDTLTYKYGCSDVRFNNLGPMHLLYWKAIEDGKLTGMKTLDLGRTDAHQQGLITFKNRWGAAQSAIAYERYGRSESSTHVFDLTVSKFKNRVAQQVLSHLPAPVLSRIGQVLYGHIG